MATELSPKKVGRTSHERYGSFKRWADSQITRRSICNGLLISTGLVVAAKSTTLKAATQQIPGSNYPGIRIDGAQGLLPGTALLFNYPKRNDPAILIRAQDANYYAYSQKCSHLGCSVHFNRGLEQLECACHKGAYELKNGVPVVGPPLRPLDEVILQFRGAELWAVGIRTAKAEPVITD